MSSLCKFVVLGFFFIISTNSYSEDKVVSDFPLLITNRFMKQLVGAPQEKVYLQTDKPYYSAGEDIWFKAYVVNATTLGSTTLSQFVYVELINKSDSVVSRVKIKKKSFGFSGYIRLNTTISIGFYSLRAYTYWMQNSPIDFFFNKRLFIGNRIDDHILSKINYGTAVAGLIPVTLTFTDGSNNPVSGKKVEIIQNWTSATKKKVLLVTNKEGKVNWQISIAAKDNSKKSLEVAITDEKYRSKFYLPEFNSDFDLQFFPESGVLLNNGLQNIAFKAIGKDGLSVDVIGKVFTDKNEEIAELSSINKGMGKFSIQTEPNVSYYAMIKTPNGVEKRFELPRAETEAITIHLVYNHTKILYEVVNQTTLHNTSLYLLVHSRGKVFVMQKLKSLEGQIPSTLLPPGIATFAIIDSLGHTYCERLSFIRNISLTAMSMDSNKKAYGKREAVDLSLSIHSISGKPVNGSFSISVTDSRIVKSDSLADNILTNLLLTSDIKGYIEEPATYFADNSATTILKTDILMLTQGWRRFNAADIVKGIYKQPTYYLEGGQALSGRVLNLFNKPSKKSNIIVLSSYKNLMKVAQTDSLGHYLIEGIEFPDSTSFVLKARKPKSIGEVEIIPDPDNFPVSNVFIPIAVPTDKATEEEYLKQSKEKYYTEGGVRVVNLGEVTVRAAKKQDSPSSYYSGFADTEVKAEQLEQYHSMNIMDLLSTMGGIRVNGSSISIRGSMDNPMILVDDIEVLDINEITYLTADYIRSIQVFKGASASIFGFRGGNGVIAIKLKEGVVLKASTPVSIAMITPLGYQKPERFYTPKYEVDSILNSSKADLRTTIYWNPKLITDASGVIHVKFYTADKTHNYSVVMEGVSDSGEIFRYTGVLKREDK
jgi:hypothetical protein